MLTSIQASLAAKDLRFEDLQTVLIRLVDYGVICRDESQIEQQCYDLFVRMEDLVVEYLSVLALRIQHDREFQVIRAYPPGAEVPGMDSDEAVSAQGLRQRLQQQDIMLILALRVLYDQKLRAGELDDQGGAVITFETLSISLQNLFSKPLPEQAQERRSILRRVKSLRLVRYDDEVFKSEDAALLIRPGIMNFVSDDVLQALTSNEADLEAPETTDPLDEEE